MRNALTNGHPIDNIMEALSTSTYDDIFKFAAIQIVDMTDVIIWLIITGITVLVFLLGQKCVSKQGKVNQLLSTLNILERKLMTSNKECELVKHDLLDTRSKLASIEDNSFGSNEMVVALKKELDSSEQNRLELMDQVASLEKVRSEIGVLIHINLLSVDD